MCSPLLIEFCGETYECTPGNHFSFGRSADLVIDDNRFLHRVMGVCSERNGWWWLSNSGASLPLHLQGQIGTASITLSPGGSVPLVLGPTTVRFAAGGTSYELLLTAPWVDVAVSEPIQAEGLTTIDAADMPLTADQLLLLVALSETRLRKGSSAEIASNQDIMDRFAWTTTKFNRKLDGLCQKFARRGVAGLVGDQNRMAMQRRQHLVDHVIASGMVTVEQLALLPTRSGSAPRSFPSTDSIPSVHR
jgi:hypothetical protein